MKGWLRSCKIHGRQRDERATLPGLRNRSYASRDPQPVLPYDPGPKTEHFRFCVTAPGHTDAYCKHEREDPTRTSGFCVTARYAFQRAYNMPPVSPSEPSPKFGHTTTDR